MSHSSDAWFYRVKAAQKDLIKICGGIARVADLTSVSISHVGRWNSPKDKDLMPINVIIELEADCGMPLVTSAMAEMNGFRVEDPERAAKQTAGIMTGLSEVMTEAGALFASGAAAAADGRFTPAELTVMQRNVSVMSQKASDLQNTLAAAHADESLRTVVS